MTAMALAATVLLAAGGLVAATAGRPAAEPGQPRAGVQPDARRGEDPPPKPEAKKPDEKKPVEVEGKVRTTLTIDRVRSMPLVLSPDGKMLALPGFLGLRWGVKLLDAKDG